MTKQEAIEFFKHQCKECRSLFAEPNCNECVSHIAIECIEECIKHEETFEWCDTCKEYDQDEYCCHRWSKCINETVKDLEEFYKLEGKGLVPQTTVIG